MRTRLKELGSEWLAQFPRIDFIGEIEVTEERVQELCRLFSESDNLDWARYDHSIRAALAVAVVNLAYYSRKDEINDESFRRYVLSKFKQEVEEEIWREKIGEPILQLLKKHFDEVDRSGPYRFVRPIMRQAGVPAHLTGQFADFVHQLIKRCGWRFAEDQYFSFCNSYNQLSSNLENFLSTRAGWHFSLDVTHNLKNYRDGIFNAREASALPGFRGRLIEQLGEYLQGGKAVKKLSLPLPKLIFSREQNNTLAIEFARQGLNGGYLWLNGKRIRNEYYELTADDLDSNLRVKIVEEESQEYWNLPWYPNNDGWAVFTPEGVFQQARGPIKADRYIVILPSRYSNIIWPYVEQSDSGEEIGPLFIEDMVDLDLLIFECDLPNGFEIKEIGLFVEASQTVAPPTLRFSKRARRLPQAHNVFIGELPEIEIAHWAEDFAERYILFIDYGKGPKLISLTSERINYQPPINSQGIIRLELKGRGQRDFQGLELRYSLLSEASLQWPTELYEYAEMPIIEFHSANKFEMEWETIGIKRSSPDRWLVPVGINFVSGRIKFETLNIPISGRVDRFTIDGDPMLNRVLWQETLKQRGNLRLYFSQLEKNKPVNFGIVDGYGFRGLIDLPKVPANCELIISTDLICDAFDDAQAAAGYLAVQVADGRGGLKVVKAEAYYLNEAEIMARLRFDDENEFKIWSEYLPGNLHNAFTAIRKMHEQPIPAFTLPVMPMPATMSNYLQEYRACNSVFDQRERVDNFPNLLDGQLKDILNWYIAAQEFVLNTHEYLSPLPNELLKRLPKDLSGLPSVRWEQQINELEKRIRGLTNLEAAIMEWQDYCTNKFWGKAKESVIGKMVGGVELTQATESYFYGLDRRVVSKIDSNNWLMGAKNNFDNVMKIAGSGIIWEIAAVLRAMSIYYVRQSEFRNEAASLIEQLGAHWQKLKVTFELICDPDRQCEFDAKSFGLSNISPHQADRQLEERYINER